MEIGERIKYCMEQCDEITQQELADAIRIDRKTVNRIIRRNDGKFSDMIHIAVKLNVSLDYLAGLIDEPRKLM